VVPVEHAAAMNAAATRPPVKTSLERKTADLLELVGGPKSTVRVVAD
jgi:hypothetical protein